MLLWRRTVEVRYPTLVSVFTNWHTPLRWPSGKGVRLQSGGSWVDSCLRHGSYSETSHTNDIKNGTPVATLPGVIGSGLELVDPSSLYCHWVWQKVWSATSISVWQHVRLSEQIRPWDTFALCYDVKQPTNKHWSTNIEQVSLISASVETSLLATTVVCAMINHWCSQHPCQTPDAMESVPEPAEPASAYSGPKKQT